MPQYGWADIVLQLPAAHMPMVQPRARASYALIVDNFMNLFAHPNFRGIRGLRLARHMIQQLAELHY